MRKNVTQPKWRKLKFDKQIITRLHIWIWCKDLNPNCHVLLEYKRERSAKSKPIWCFDMKKCAFYCTCLWSYETVILIYGTFIWDTKTQWHLFWIFLILMYWHSQQYKINQAVKSVSCLTKAQAIVIILQFWSFPWYGDLIYFSFL